VFKIIGNKEELREPLINFVNEVNTQMSKSKDKIRETVRSRLNVFKLEGLADKVEIPDTIVALEEVEDGFILKTLFFSNNKLLRKIFFMSMKKAKKNLEGYLKAVGVKKFKIKKWGV